MCYLSKPHGNQSLSDNCVAPRISIGAEGLPCTTRTLRKREGYKKTIGAKNAFEDKQCYHNLF